MSKRTCTMPDCGKPYYATGRCRSHYSKLQRERRANTASPCKVDNCGEPGVGGRGWCQKHYRRFQRHGDPLATSRIVGDDLARFWSYVDRTGSCWNWTGATSKDGYGIILVRRETKYAPRHAWELMHGPMPEGLEPDHLCRNRACVNPDHLEPVSHRENVLRGESPTAKNARKTHCKLGHEFTEENTYITPSTGGRNCRTCLGVAAARRRGPVNA